MNILDFKSLVNDKKYEQMMEYVGSSIEPNDYLYHYTSQYTLSEILDKKEIWLSHALDMNDPGEICFGIEIVKDILSESLPSNSKVLECIIEENNHLEEFNRYEEADPYFVFSFSEKEDDLKQWVHYADNCNGVSIEFVLMKIIDTMKEEHPNNLNPLLLPVNYFNKNNKANSKSNVNYMKLINNFFSNIEQVLELNNFDIDTNFKRIVFDHVVFFATFIKNNLYSEEKEWRLVIQTGIGNKKINTKIIRNIAQMKLILALDERSILNIINSVMIGPKNYSNGTNRKAIELLTSQKLGGSKIHINRSCGEIK